MSLLKIVPAPTDTELDLALEARSSRRGSEYFDGQAIDDSRVKLTACANLEDTVGYSLEDDITLTIKGQVTGIDHRVDKRTGNLVRHHTITVSEIVRAETTTVELS